MSAMFKTVKVIGYMFLALTLNSSASWADDTKGSEDGCAVVHAFAKTVMEARQEGVSLVTMIGIAGDDSVAKAIVMGAYEKPQYSGEEYRAKEASEFSNDIALECYKQQK